MGGWETKKEDWKVEGEEFGGQLARDQSKHSAT